MKPLVTVYITNYNYQDYIKQSIESVLAQSFSFYELLIIDDGSTDNSKRIIEDYRAQRKVSIIYQQNKGLNITNNIAMRAAQGKYIMRLDADDFLAPNALEKMSTILEKDEELGLVFPDYYYVDKDGNVTGEEKRHNFEKEVSLYDQPAHGACTMIRLDFLKRLGGYNESFTCQDGYELWIKFITHYKVTNINEPLFYYRRHGNNLTTNEGKILNTRKKIKELFVKENFITPPTLAVIPVRNTYIGNVNWPLYEINGQTILERKIITGLSANNLSAIAVSTSDKEILACLSNLKSKYPSIYVVERPDAFSLPSETLFKTVDQALEIVQQTGNLFEAVMTVSLDYPFVNSDIIDDVINTLVLFKTDSVLSVRPDDKTYYQHTGHTLQPILNHNLFTRLEREALYRGSGGVSVSTIENFKMQKQVISGSVGHVVVDQQSSFSVTSSFELGLFRTYLHQSDFVNND